MNKWKISLKKSLEESCLFIKVVNEIIKTKAKGQNTGFLGLLLCTLAARRLGNTLTAKPKLPVQGVLRAG